MNEERKKKISIVIIQRAHRDGNRESESERALNDVLCHLCLVYVRVRVYIWILFHQAYKLLDNNARAQQSKCTEYDCIRSIK